MNSESVNATDSKPLQEIWVQLAVESGRSMFDRNFTSWPTSSSLTTTLSESHMVSNNLLFRRLRELHSREPVVSTDTSNHNDGELKVPALPKQEKAARAITLLPLPAHNIISHVFKAPKAPPRKVYNKLPKKRVSSLPSRINRVSTIR
ncbi:unnamed protein product [Mucor hiemalis]